jgi:hypothetical protein
MHDRLVTVATFIHTYTAQVSLTAVLGGIPDTSASARSLHWPIAPGAHCFSSRIRSNPQSAISGLVMCDVLRPCCGCVFVLCAMCFGRSWRSTQEGRARGGGAFFLIALHTAALYVRRACSLPPPPGSWLPWRPGPRGAWCNYWHSARTKVHLAALFRFSATATCYGQHVQNPALLICIAMAQGAWSNFSLFAQDSQSFRIVINHGCRSPITAGLNLVIAIPLPLAPSTVKDVAVEASWNAEQ